jgi:hypothetical protein
MGSMMQAGWTVARTSVMVTVEAPCSAHPSWAAKLTSTWALCPGVSAQSAPCPATHVRRGWGGQAMVPGTPGLRGRSHDADILHLHMHMSSAGMA